MQRAAAMMWFPEKLEDAVKAMSLFSDIYRGEIIPWQVNTRQQSQSEKRRAEKRVRKKVDLKDAKSVESYYYSMVEAVNRRYKKKKKEQ